MRTPPDAIALPRTLEYIKKKIAKPRILTWEQINDYQRNAIDNPLRVKITLSAAKKTVYKRKTTRTQRKLPENVDKRMPLNCFEHTVLDVMILLPLALVASVTSKNALRFQNPVQSTIPEDQDNSKASSLYAEGTFG